jgi:multidrug efflux pump
MNISAPFIHRPVATTLLTVGVALCGAVAFMLLPVAPLPRIDVPAIFVSAQLPGASPEVMASAVATPLERHLGTIADVDDMTSTNSVGTTSIQLTFGVDRDIDGAARDVQAAIVAAHADLPSSLTRNPTYRKINSARFPVMAIAMTSDVLTQGQIYDAADAVISQRLSQIEGVGGVNVNGSALPAVRVEINPLALSKYGIGLPDVRAAISNSNANAPKGAIESDRLHYQIYTNDNARDAAPYRDLIIANRNGATVRLGDVAKVSDMQDGATENIRTYGLYNGLSAARRQRHPDDRRREGRAAAAQELNRSEDRLGGHLRSLDHHSRLAAAGRTDPAARRRHGDIGRLRIPEQLSRRLDSGAGGAGIVDRHLRSDVSA